MARPAGRFGTHAAAESKASVTRGRPACARPRALRAARVAAPAAFRVAARSAAQARPATAAHPASRRAARRPGRCARRGGVHMHTPLRRCIYMDAAAIWVECEMTSFLALSFDLD
jgi:hypothetical protein